MANRMTHLFPPGETTARLIRRAAGAMHYRAATPLERAQAGFLDIAAESVDVLVREEAEKVAREFLIAGQPSIPRQRATRR